MRTNAEPGSGAETPSSAPALRRGVPDPLPAASAASRRRLLGLTLTAAMTGVVGACGLLPPPGLKSPQVKIGEVSIRRITGSEIGLLVTLDTVNPNDREIPLSNLRVDLDLLGRPFGEGRAVESNLLLPPNAERAIPIEFTVRTARIVEVMRDLRLGSDSPFPYVLRGSANWGASPLPVRFERTGELEALRGLRNLLRPLLRP